jgi:hypothetical protein
LVSLLCEMLAAVLIAKLSYDLYEARFLRLKRYFKTE